nr:MAG: hypothetical protein DIU58_06765 [Sphaerobacter thermophilus]
MKRWILLVLVTAMLALLPGVALAQEPGDDDFLLRVNSQLTVPPDDTVETVMVINAQGTFDGVIENSAVVINGNAVVNGVINGDLTVINGQADLRDGARVRNVALVNSTINQAPGAQVTGQVTRTTATFNPWDFTAAWLVLWLGMTLLVVIGGLIFAAIGGRQLSAAGEFLATRPGPVILAALIIGIGLPILGVIAFPTIIGIPFGIAVFLVLLPAIWVIGYLIAGTTVGAALLKAFGNRTSAEHPYLAAVVGLVILQIIGLVPFIGGLIVALAGMYGAGGAPLPAWQGFRTPRTRRPQRPPGAPAPAP